MTGKSQGLNPLESAAGPLLALLTRLRNTIAHPAPASLRAQLLAYLRQFEERAEAAGVARNEVLLARYALCTALDEAVLSTPWGSTSDWGKQSLLITVHNEAWGGEKVFQLLDHCLQRPTRALVPAGAVVPVHVPGFRRPLPRDERWAQPTGSPAGTHRSGQFAARVASMSANCRRIGAA